MSQNHKDYSDEDENNSQQQLPSSPSNDNMIEDFKSFVNFT